MINQQYNYVKHFILLKLNTSEISINLINVILIYVFIYTP